MSDVTIMAWHFAGDMLRDGRPLPADGETLIHDGPLIMCKSGLHASERLIDALQYAPGPNICRVECGGTIKRDTDKLICTRRTIQWRIDGSTLLREFARKCALDVAHLWSMPVVVRQYLETGDRILRDAAWATGRDAAWDAGRAAAWAAAGAAARDAGRAAARDAVGAAGRAAARDAARAAARDAQNDRLTAMAEAHRSAPITEGTT